MESAGPSLKRRRREPTTNSRNAGGTQSATSHLANYLLSNMAWGHLSPQQCQKIAQLAAEDCKTSQEFGLVPPKLLSVAKAGSSGKYAYNVHRDLMTVAGAGHCSLGTKVTMQFAKPLGEKTTEILFPHEVFSAVYHQYPEAFKKHLLPSEAKLGHFWKSVKDHPSLVNHPIFDEGCHKAIPLAIHGDEVPVVGVGKVWSKTFLTWHWYSLMAAAATTSTTDLMIWLWGCFTVYLENAGSVTINTFLSMLSWSLTALFYGVWPSRDWRGMQCLGSSSAMFSWNLFISNTLNTLWCLANTQCMTQGTTAFLLKDKELDSNWLGGSGECCFFLQEIWNILQKHSACHITALPLFHVHYVKPRSMARRPTSTADCMLHLGSIPCGLCLHGCSGRTGQEALSGKYQVSLRYRCRMIGCM